MTDKLRKYGNKLGEILERFMAIIVIAAVIIAIISLWEPFYNFWIHRTETASLRSFMERVLDIIIGIELFKMLCRPGAGTVLEVMMFCISRHMIVHETSSLENLLTIVGVALVIIIRKIFVSPKGSDSFSHTIEKEE